MGIGVMVGDNEIWRMGGVYKEAWAGANGWQRGNGCCTMK